jgi:hypothetical protein
MKPKWRPMLMRMAVATSAASVIVFLNTPPGYVRDQFGIHPFYMGGVLMLIATLVFALLLVGQIVISWATRADRVLRRGGVVSCITGSFSAFCGLTLWLAFFAIPTIAIGVVAACLVLRREMRDSEGHSLVNLTGLVLNLVTFGIVLSQVITATIWR